MARVLPVEVKKVFSTDADVAPFIETASLLVTEELSAAGLSSDRLKLIETYLAAHFAAVSLENGGLKRKKIGEGEEEYQTVSAKSAGLTSTRFGQQAVLLDPSGTLGQISQAPTKALFRVVGDGTCS